MPTIRTVLGDIDPATAGAVDSHDHLFLAAASLPGEELSDEQAAADELRAFSAAGGGTIVQWTPRGLKRGLGALRRISVTTGIHVVAATGRHRKPVYGGRSAEFDMSAADLARAFIGDITERGCGLIKVGISSSAIEPDEADALEAAALAHHATGAPIAVHLEDGSAYGLVLDALHAQRVGATSVVVGHLGRNPELNAIIDAAQSGAWLCLDTPSPGHPEADRLGRIVEALVDEGHVGQLLLGADTTVASARSEPLSFGPSALLRSVAPRLRDVLGDDGIGSMLVHNPARAWAMRGASEN